MTGVVVAGLAATACETPKEPDASKRALVESGGTTKSGTQEAVLAAQLLTAVVEAGASKDVSSVSVGETVSGSLGSGDDQLGDGSYYDAWGFTISSPQVVSVRMSSSDFDTYLKLYQGSPGQLGADLGSDDDGGGGTNSALSLSLPAGSYTILANSYSAGGAGSYSLAVTGSAGSGSGSASGSALSAGQSASGELTSDDPTLDDGTHYDVWTYYGEAGEQVTVTLSSDEVDTYLIAMRGTPESGEPLDENDDADGTNSRLTLRLPASGMYTFLANTYGAGETGSYTISLSSTPSVPIEERFVTNGPSNGRYALLVGIDDYPGTGSDLRGPVEDARIMERVLVERFGFDPRNVVTLNDSDATRENIANGIVHHLGNAGPDGVAVFFYSGHGTQIGENIGVGAPVDPEPRGEGDEAIYIYGPDGGASSVILDEELGYLIETIDAGRTLVVVDACFSGEITRASGDAPQSKVVSLDDPEIASMVELPTRFINSEVKALGDMSDLSLGFGNFQAIATALSNPQRHIMWGASTEDQVSWTSGLGNGASVFTYFMGERLMSAPTSSSFTQVQQQVHADVVDYIEGNGNMTMQNPQMRGSNAGMSLEAFFRQR